MNTCVGLSTSFPVQHRNSAIRKIFHGLLLGVCGTVAFLPNAFAGTLLLNQTIDNGTWFSSYFDSTDGSPNTEAADDFTLVGTIDRIHFGGRKNATSLIQSVYVRFYDANPSGGPGALQQEYQLNVGNPLLTTSFDYVDVVLPTVFSANGHHFVTLQIVSTSSWETGSAHFSTLDPKNGERVYQRSNGGAWTASIWNTDMAMSIYGTVTGAPTATSVSPTAATRSDYIEIRGAAFGDAGQVTVGGVAAQVIFWSNDLIKAYVAEATPLGDQSVVVQTANGTAAPLTLTVSDRVASGRLKWQFSLAGPYSMERPSIGADGTIYTVDIYGYLYALSPTGALKWVRTGGDAGVDIGPDGTIYSGGTNSVFAYNADGTLKWRYNFTYPYGFFDIAVGPDGNIYVGTTGGDLGIFSLTPAGQLRWNDPVPSSKGAVNTGVEIAFGYNGSQLQVYFDLYSQVRAYKSSGNFLFLIPGRSPSVSSTQLIHTLSGVLRPDGSSVCSIPFEGANGYGLGANDTHWGYNLDLISYDESCRQVSRFTVPTYVNQKPITDSNNSFVMTGSTILDSTTGTSTQVTYALDTRNGSELWRQTYPTVSGLNQRPSSDVRMTTDNSTAYFHTNTAGTGARGFLTALDVTGTGGGGGGGGTTPPPPTSNNSPIANDDSATTFQKTSVKVKVLANDSDPDGDTIKVNSVAPDANVTAQINSDGSLTIKPKGNFLGTATATYDVVDSKGAVSNRATVTLSVVKK